MAFAVKSGARCPILALPAAIFSKTGLNWKETQATLQLELFYFLFFQKIKLDLIETIDLFV